MTELTEEQEARIAALEAEIAKLKAAAEPKAPFVPQPFERFDPTARASMSPTMMAELAGAVPDGLVRDVVGDFRARPSLPAAASAGAEPAKSVGSGGWTDAVPLRSPPGVELMDKGMDQQDAIDKLALAKRLAGGSGAEDRR